jgi:broad specificity phosphatase PhoE
MKSYKQTVWQGERTIIEPTNEFLFNNIFKGVNSIFLQKESLYATKINNGSKIVYDVVATYKPNKKVIYTIDIPYDQNPGIYSDKNNILVVEVIPIVLPNVKNWIFHLDLWQNPWAVSRYHNVECWGPRHMYLLENHIKLLADHGQKVITTTVLENVWASQTLDEHLSMVKWNIHNDIINFDFNVFIQYVNLCTNAGITGQISVFSILPWGTNQGCGFKDGEAKYTLYNNNNNKVIKYATPGDETYYLLWTAFLKSFIKIINENCWNDRIYFAFDERHEDEMKEAIKMLYTVLPSIGYSSRIQISSAYKYNQELDQYITDLSIGYSNHLDWTNLTQKRRNNNNKTTFYLCEHPRSPFNNTFLDSAVHESRWIGWYSFANGFDGFLRWAYDSWPEDPLINGDFPGPHGHWPAGDTFLCYPNSWKSLRLMKIRQGIQDYEKLRIMYVQEPVLITEMMKEYILSGNSFQSITLENSLKILDNISKEFLKKTGVNFSKVTIPKTIKSVESYLFIVRHGDRIDHFSKQKWKDIKSANLYINSKNPPLCSNGQKQAMEVARNLKKEVSIDNIYVSPYLRTLQTSNYFAYEFDKELKVEEGLAEGWHTYIDDKLNLIDKFPNIDLNYDSRIKLKNNEIFPNEFENRIKKYAQHVMLLEGCNLLVTHAGTGLFLTSVLCDIHTKHLEKIGGCEFFILKKINERYTFIEKKKLHSCVQYSKPCGYD